MNQADQILRYLGLRQARHGTGNLGRAQIRQRDGRK